MYTGSGFSDWEIGDITVIIHNSKYHLFHLIIPNHDYIAHAVSDDGISWKRVKNALFVGHPGEWDDDMLWTMHVCAIGETFEMYYTGLQRKDRGVISRIGYAESKDLVDWVKNSKNIYPVEPKGIYYETSTSNPRTWLSFRDPFKFEYKGDVYLLLGARTIKGPISRRGCVGIVKITSDLVQLMPPLFYPRMYDDVECPCVFEMNNKFYLIGSIREDIKVRYRVADDFFGNYTSFPSDVLLPVGNYAARIVQDGEHLLIYNFFYAFGKIDALRVLPPPKQLETDPGGRLLLKTYYRWKLMILYSLNQNELGNVYSILNNDTAFSEIQNDKWTVGTSSGYELFCFTKPSASFIWEGVLTAEGNGKFGLLSDLDNEGDGYYMSFNVLNGQAVIRAWGFNPVNARQNFIFNEIQKGFFNVPSDNSISFRLIRFGRYIELSIQNIVVLTLIDYMYSGNNLGIYACSGQVNLRHSVLSILPDPVEEYAGQEEAQKI